MRGNVYRSIDGGTTWTKVAFAAAIAINGGSVSVDGRVVLVGNNGVLAVSTDNGNSFVADNGPSVPARPGPLHRSTAAWFMWARSPRAARKARRPRTLEPTGRE